MNDSSRTQGGLICVAVVVIAAWFLLGLLMKSYWAIAIPVAILVFFVLGLTFWVGYTIATIEVEPYEEVEPSPEADAEKASEPRRVRGSPARGASCASRSSPIAATCSAAGRASTPHTSPASGTAPGTTYT
jgi:energy-coupling factor transporter transmembrane protein EcfT